MGGLNGAGGSWVPLVEGTNMSGTEGRMGADVNMARPFTYEGFGAALSHVLWRQNRHLGGIRLSVAMQMSIGEAMGGGGSDSS